MRHVRDSLCLGVILLSVGCADSKWSFMGKKNDDARYANVNPTWPNLVAFLTRKAQSIQSIEGHNLELVRETMNQGQRVQKVTEFSRVPAKVQVRAHKLRDARGKDICSAQIIDVEDINGAIVPRKLVLSYPAEKLELKMTLFSSARE